MFETRDEVVALQSLLDASITRAGAHLRSIVDPTGRVLDAGQVTAVLTGMCTLTLATVTARGEPRVSGVDGHFLHGHWVVGTARSAVKARHLAARPAVSASHLRGEDLGVFVHGRVVELAPLGGPVDPAWPAVVDHLAAHYDASPQEWDDEGTVYWRIEPTWMVAYCPDPSSFEGGPSRRAEP